MTTPTDGVEGTQGKLFYWTRQGISLADFEKAVADAIDRVNQAGGVAGITDIGHGLITAATQADARAIIDAASTAEAAAGGGGGSGGTIDLPIAITDVTDLATELADRSLTGHHHVVGDINGLSASVLTLLDADDVAGITSAAGAAAAGHHHVPSADLTTTGTPSSSTYLRGDNAWAPVTGMETAPWLLGTTAGVYPPRPATTRSVWFVDPNVQPTNDGLVTGGGGMVPDGTLPNGLMDFWVS